MPTHMKIKRIVLPKLHIIILFLWLVAMCQTVTAEKFWQNQLWKGNKWQWMECWRTTKNCMLGRPSPSSSCCSSTPMDWTCPGADTGVVVTSTSASISSSSSVILMSKSSVYFFRFTWRLERRFCWENRITVESTNPVYGIDLMLCIQNSMSHNALLTPAHTYNTSVA